MYVSTRQADFFESGWFRLRSNARFSNYLGEGGSLEFGKSYSSHKRCHN